MASWKSARNSRTRRVVLEEMGATQGRAQVAGQTSETELRAELQDARIVRRSHFPKVCITGIGIDPQELRVVERVERLEPELKFRSGFAGGEFNIFEQRKIEIEQSRSHDRILTGIAKTIIRTAIPRSDWICKGAFAKPGVYGVRIAHRRYLVYPVSTDTSQAENVRAGVGKANPIAANGHARLCDCYPRELPAS